MECFQWKSKEDIEKYINSDKSVEIHEEMADILLYLINLAGILEIDLLDAAYKKMEKNARKYPVEKAKDNAKKYTQL